MALGAPLTNGAEASSAIGSSEAEAAWDITSPATASTMRRSMASS